MSISRFGPVNPSTPIFPNTNLTKIIKNLLFQKPLKNGCNNLYFYPYAFDESKTDFRIWRHFPVSWFGKSINANFPQYESERKNKKFNCCLKTQSETAARISICSLNTLNLPSNQIHIWC